PLGRGALPLPCPPPPAHFRLGKKKRAPSAPAAPRHVSRMDHPSTAVRLPITRTTKLCTIAPLRHFVARLIVAVLAKVKREPRQAPAARARARDRRRSRRSLATDVATRCIGS